MVTCEWVWLVCVAPSVYFRVSGSAELCCIFGLVSSCYYDMASGRSWCNGPLAFPVVYVPLASDLHAHGPASIE